MNALALRRCVCGEPVEFPEYAHRFARLCARCQHHALTVFPPDPYIARLPPPGDTPRTSDEWIAEHAHEWETGVADWPAAT